MEKSEFGKGFTYCIGLFLCHAERKMSDLFKEDNSEMWFNGAADHLYQLNVPEEFKLKKECRQWQNKCIQWRLSGFGTPKATDKDRSWAIAQAKKFLRAWDKQCGIKTQKGQWE